MGDRFPPSVATSLRILGNELDMLLELSKERSANGASSSSSLPSPSLTPEAMTKAALTALDSLTTKVRSGNRRGNG
jgi:hypothetical protein